MDDEKFISGYCRCLDCSRTVTVELTDGRITDVDCSYPNCVHAAACPIAKEIDQLK